MGITVRPTGKTKSFFKKNKPFNDELMKEIADNKRKSKKKMNED